MNNPLILSPNRFEMPVSTISGSLMFCGVAPVEWPQYFGAVSKPKRASPNNFSKSPISYTD